MSKLIFIFSTAVLFAAVGSTGSNGQIPYLTVSSKYVDEPITITLHQASQGHEMIFYLFSLTDDFQDWTNCVGPGGYILRKEGLMIHACNEEQVVIDVNPECAGMSFYLQAVVREKDPTPFGSYYTVSRPTGITLTDKYAAGNLEIELAGFVPHAGDVEDMAEQDGYIYCASAQFGLVKFKKNSAGNPTWAGTLRGGSFIFTPKHVVMNDQLALLTNESYMLGVVDISMPNQDPVNLGECTIHGYAFYDGALHTNQNGTYALMNAKSSGLVVLDVNNPPALSVVNSLLTGESIRTVKAYDGYLYVLTQSGMGYVYDLATSPNLTQVAQFTLPSAARSICFQADIAYVLSGKSTDVFIYSLPAGYGGGQKPQLVNQVNLNGAGYFSNAVAGCDSFDNEFLYLIDYSEIHQYSVNPDHSLTPTYIFTVGEQVTDVMADGGVIHAARSGYQQGIETFDLGTMQKLPLPEYNKQHDKLWDLCLVDKDLGGSSHSFCYVLEYMVGIHVIDVMDPEYPELLQTIAGPFYSVANLGDQVLCAESPNVVKICDVVSVDGDLSTVSELTTLNKPRGLAVSGNYLHIADGPEGLTIYSLEDPELPEFDSNFKDPSFVSISEVKASGYLAYLTGTAGTAVVDVSDRENPEMIQMLPYYGSYWGRGDCDGFLLFLANLSKGIEIFDASKPFSQDGIAFNSCFNLPNDASDAAIMGNIAVVSMMYGGYYASEKYLIFYDITDPSNISMITKFRDVPGFNGAVEASNGYLYATDKESLLNIIRLE
jgi:hypothetical protein